MLNYDQQSNVLTIKKIVDIVENFNLLANTRNSYTEYLEKTIHEDVKYLEKRIAEINNTFKEMDISLEVDVDPYVKENRYIPGAKNPDKYRQVTLIATYRGVKHEYDFLRIPYMDDYGVLNVKGKRNVLLNELVGLECLSWDNKSKSLQAIGQSRSIKLEYKPDDIVISQSSRGKKVYTISYLTFLPDFLRRDGVNVQEALNLFSNPLVAVGRKKFEKILDDLQQTKRTTANLLEKYSAENFKLGRLRDDLNEKLSIDICLGQTLSRDIVLTNGSIISQGQVVTNDILALLKRNTINEVYIKKIPRISGQVLVAPVKIDTIPKGVRVSQTLKSLMPEMKLNSYTTSIRNNVGILIDVGTVLTDELLQLLDSCGVSEVVYIKGDDRVSCKFEQEVIGNKTFKVIDLNNGSLPVGFNAQSYVYVDDNFDIKDKSTWKKSPDYLTCWDMMALISNVSRIVCMPELNETYDRDVDFLKRIAGVSETFSYAFRRAVDTHITKYKNDIIRSFTSSNQVVELFFDFTKEWLKVLREEKKLLAQAEDINPISLLKQVNTVSTWVKSADSVKEEQRTLALGFFGRLCPYDIPAGTKMGLVNTLAIGCKIEDGGIMKTPYRKIIWDGKGFKLSDKVKYLTTLEEQKVRIGDALNLKFDGNGYILPTMVIARVPTHDNSSNERVDVATIKSTDLDYVNAFAEQFLSPAAALIPFAAGNDSARITFGINLMTQSIYLQKGEVPLVSTSMYKKVFDYSNDFVIRAEDDGVVEEIRHDSLALLYDKDVGGYNDPTTVISLEETRFFNLATISLRFRVKPGERFKKGDILVDSPVSRDGIFSPGANLLACYMPWDGYNYEDAIVLSKAASDKLVSIHPNECEYKCPTDNYHIHLRDSKVGTYLIKGQTVGIVLKTRKGNNTNVIEENWRADENGWLYETAQSEIDGESIITARLLSFDKVQPGDKLSGRHGNKGVDSIVEETANMPVFRNGKRIELILNPTGVPSRMNIGQLLDATAGFIAYILGVRIETEAFNGASIDELSMLMSYIWDLANEQNVSGLLSKYPTIPSELHTHALDRISEIRKWKGCFNKDCTAELYNPKTGKFFNNPVGIGMPYFLKIRQEVDHKMHARSGMLEEPYNLIDEQPPKGSSNKGGQRTGEMEANAVLAHGAAGFAQELFNDKSDNTTKRVKRFLEAIDAEDAITLEDEEFTSPRGMYIMRYLLETVGVNMDISNYPGISQKEIEKLRYYNGESLYKYILKGNKKTNIDLTEFTEEEAMQILSGIVNTENNDNEEGLPW